VEKNDLYFEEDRGGFAVNALFVVPVPF